MFKTKCCPSEINSFEFKIRCLLSGEVCVVDKKYLDETLSFNDNILDNILDKLFVMDNVNGTSLLIKGFLVRREREWDIIQIYRKLNH